MSDLIEFIRARYDEVEEIARMPGAGGYEPEIWEVRPSRSGRWSEVISLSRTMGEPRNQAVRESDQPTALVQSGRWEDRHIALHDPQRVVDDINSKRRILAWLECTARSRSSRRATAR